MREVGCNMRHVRTSNATEALTHMRKIAAYAAVAVISLVIGFAGGWYLQVLGFKQSAVASIYLTGECLRSGDLVQSMFYAQKVIHDAPEAYDGYQLAGEVYHRQGYNLGAVAMYEAAIKKLRTGGTEAMLVENGVTSVATAEEHLREKLKSVQ